MVVPDTHIHTHILSLSLLLDVEGVRCWRSAAFSSAVSIPPSCVPITRELNPFVLRVSGRSVCVCECAHARVNVKTGTRRAKRVFFDGCGSTFSQAARNACLPETTPNHAVTVLGCTWSCWNFLLPIIRDSSATLVIIIERDGEDRKKEREAGREREKEIKTE